MKTGLLVIAVCFLAGCIFFIAGAAYHAFAADEQKPIEWQTIPGGEYYTANNAMVMVVDTPLMADRFKTYGKVEIEKDGSRKVDQKNVGAVTPAGMKVYDGLLALKTDKNAFKIHSVTMEHTRALIVKFDQYEWSELLPDITKILEDAIVKTGEK